MPIFVQQDRDRAARRAAGFTDVRVLADGAAFNGVTLHKTGGQHGTDDALSAIGDILGEVSGVVVRHPDERSLYVAGDTVWNHHVADSLALHRPDIVVLNAGGDQVAAYIVFAGTDTGEIMGLAPTSDGSCSASS